jgi:predicted lipoprotein with Yx(FWY)xxD motif
MAAATVEAPAATPAARPRPKRGVVVRLVRSQFGPILGDGRGQAFYLFERETTSRPRCYGDCARAWPPVFARGAPVAGRGADADLIGTTRRADGRRQLTYRGQPMYYYVSDSPGVVLCQNVDEFGGLWLVVKPDGRALT